MMWAFRVVDEDLALGDGDAAVDVAAAQRHVERRRVPVLPQHVPVLASRAQTQPSQPETNMMPSTTSGEASNEYVDLPECSPPSRTGRPTPGGACLTFLLVIWSRGL
jgi:hypothetical protein